MDGFLLPGHVSIVLGEDSYQYLVDEYNISGVITGFETAELLSGIYKLIDLVLKKEKAILITQWRLPRLEIRLSMAGGVIFD
ncbi:hypothetical protein [Neobacillus terrae]|uniref:hypothetical protein n=1 Tax=Neobacillus terrae TaxID=3034837 RepID=UPI001FB05211|nr:hypothetical protein [Neobacillus terrae]